MKVLQLIDSLEAGGAERVAVNIANMLSVHIEKSYLCATRNEGILKDKLNNRVGYLFLGKKRTIDFKSISKLYTFINKEKITVLHAHSSSFFLATLMKIKNKKLKVVWHDHYGNSEYVNDRKSIVLKLCSLYFDQIFSVNKQLEDWAKTVLKHREVLYLPNFAVKSEAIGETQLKGVKNKRVAHLANLRPQKDHFTLIASFVKVIENYPDWTLHCIGKDFNDEYSVAIKKEIIKLNLNKNIFFYGSIPDVGNVLNQCDIGVLSSKSEGLPMALLEYGMSALPVVVTSVGECATVITDKINGLIVQPQNPNALSQAIITYINREDLRDNYKISYVNHIKRHYSEEVAIKTILKIYKKIV